MRAAAVDALAVCGAPGHAPLVSHARALLRDASSTVRWKAVVALRGVGIRAVAEVAPLLEDAIQEVRTCANRVVECVVDTLATAVPDPAAFGVVLKFCRGYTEKILLRLGQILQRGDAERVVGIEEHNVWVVLCAPALCEGGDELPCGG